MKIKEFLFLTILFLTVATVAQNYQNECTFRRLLDDRNEFCNCGPQHQSNVFHSMYQNMWKTIAVLRKTSELK